MRILNQALQSQPLRKTQSKSVPSKSNSAQLSPADDANIGDNGQRKIVKMERPNRLSESAVRAKIEELKAQKQEEKKVVKQNNIVSTIPDDIEIKNRSSIIKKNDGTDIVKEKKVIEPKVSEELKAQKQTDVVIEETKNVAQASPEKMKDKKDHTLKSDIDANDPNDTNVQEKLRTLLRVGGFNFSQKEKDALGEILNK